jgi:hypothetical protein
MVTASSDCSLPKARFTALLWLEGIKALSTLGAAAYVVWTVRRPDTGVGGLIYGLIALFLVPAFLILGVFHIGTALRLFFRKVPVRGLIVAADIVGACLGLFIGGLLFGLAWIGLCVFELYTVLSDDADRYWSSASSDSSASSTSG